MPNYDLTLTGAELDQALTDAQTALQPTNIASGSITAKTGDLDFNSIGGLSPEDQLKLDNIEANATADQTAQEIVASIDADSTAEANLKGALGLGSAAYTDTAAYGTATQGSQGATAYSWGDHSSAGYLTTETDTAALGALSAHEGASDPHPVYRLSADSVPFSEVSTTPTTLAGYGITDAATSAQGTLANSALQPGDIDTLAELNALLTDATLIDTGDSRLTDARTPTAHAASHATGQSDEITPASIGAEPAGVSAADITDSGASGRAVLQAVTAAAAQQAMDVEPGVDVMKHANYLDLPTAGLQAGGTNQVVSATGGTTYPITTPFSTGVTTDSSGAISWDGVNYEFDVIRDCKVMVSGGARITTATAKTSNLSLRDAGGAWNIKISANINSTYQDHLFLGYVRDVLAGERIQLAFTAVNTDTFTVNANSSVTWLSVQVLQADAP